MLHLRPPTCGSRALRTSSVWTKVFRPRNRTTLRLGPPHRTTRASSPRQTLLAVLRLGSNDGDRRLEPTLRNDTAERTDHTQVIVLLDEFGQFLRNAPSPTRLSSRIISLTPERSYLFRCPGIRQDDRYFRDARVANGFSTANGPRRIPPARVPRIRNS